MLFENQNITDRISMLAIMEDVHYSLWENNSVDWLLVCLGSTTGRAAMASLEIPWPIILQNKNLKSEELKMVHHMPEGEGRLSLLDVIEGLESAEANRPPKMGLTHPMAGWLFHENVPLPPLENSHNKEIHIALHRRFQQ